MEGKVSVDGRPVNGGVIFFSAGEGQNSIQGTIDEDGTYQANDVPVGLVKVSVMAPRMGAIDRRAPMEGSAAAAPTAVPMPIPPKYTKFDTSGLTLTVHSGENPFDIVMTSKSH